MKKHTFLRLLLFATVGAVFVLQSASAGDRFVSRSHPQLVTSGEHYGDSIVYVTTSTVIVRQDTVYDVSERLDSTSRDTVLFSAREHTRKGHYVQMLAGGGWGTLNYPLAGGGTLTGAPQATVQLQYAYFFHEHCGISIGAAFSNVSATGRLHGERVWGGRTDSDGESYEHHTELTDWRERQTVHRLSVPLALQWQHVWNEKAGLYLMVGADLQYMLLSRYRVTRGDVVHKGYYEWSHSWIDDVHEFGPRSYDYSGVMKTATIAPGVFADLGLVIKASQQTDILLGCYFHYTPTDLNASSHTALGWRDDDLSWMPDYAGVWSSNEVGASHPWAAGLKIGFQWHARQKPHEEHRTLWDYQVTEIRTPRYVEKRDTVVNVTEEYISAAKPTIAQEPQKLPEATKTNIQKEFLVYFGLNSAEITPEVEAELLLIVETLREHPNWRIEVSGYSCSIGSHAYNERLALRRAQNVAKVLEDNGVSRRKLKITSYGDSEARQNATEAEAAEDRHVRVNLIGE